MDRYLRQVDLDCLFQSRILHRLLSKEIYCRKLLLMKIIPNTLVLIMYLLVLMSNGYFVFCASFVLLYLEYIIHLHHDILCTVSRGNLLYHCLINSFVIEMSISADPHILLKSFSRARQNED
jgi:hypothetical protein